MMNISILGSTGSIGTQTLDVVREHPEFKVTSLSCGRNIKLLEEQIREFQPAFVSVSDEKDALDLRSRIRDTKTKVYSGMEGLIAVAEDPDSELLVTGIVGMLGIRPTIAAIKAGKKIALANKETLVTAGHLIMPLAKECNVPILPVDSEHSAIFQSLQGNAENKIHRIYLTASGGPFRTKSIEEMKNAKLEDVLKNPNWDMGAKVTIDSAGMINKGLEVMEAGWLFNVKREDILVLVHPESILHSAVEYEDGAVMGQMGVPDMRLPIQYALTYPRRISLSGDRLDLFRLQNLSFFEPDLKKFRGLSLAYRAMDRGGNIPTVFNAANEKAVSLLLEGKIRFVEIPDLIERAMDEIAFISNPSLDQILDTEKAARESVNR
ncbi:MAG: 1-deoxy-D-xylulose-5-phosphate reductoisomerase [Lachnospiraceae bacterium]|nr:1-deoxy-D-xylulose-5-phosphate reductoisomerase [Lachnospiraceae bacterium]MDY3301372.1 1-deoxy-D-xylulose-5-phosphate reductoisomerase [Lachnospiraceae bacterium]